jgi:hypothetical protein
MRHPGVVRLATHAVTVRALGVLGLVGIWHAASLLHGPPFVTVLLTLGAAALGAWAIVALRSQ